MICKRVYNKLVVMWKTVFAVFLSLSVILTVLLQYRSVTVSRRNVTIRRILASNAVRECYGGKCYKMRPASGDQYEKFFIPGKQKISPYSHTFIINGADICEGNSPYLVILVPSIHNNKHIRNAIRLSWGSVAKGKIWPNKTLNESIKLAFLLGRAETANMESSIEQENMEHGDIVQGDFVDSYYNLTLKILLGLRWVSMYCNDADFILKADEDTFVNLPKLVEFLKNDSVGFHGKILGTINSYAKVRRFGKWQVDESVYPFSHYPPYASGNSYVISTNIAPRFFRIAEYMPYIPVEDAFITGILAKVVKAVHVSVPGFTFWLDRPPKTCDFVQDRKLSATKVSSQLMLYIWEQMNSNGLICK